MFMAQALSADRSCQKAVNEIAVKRLAGGLPQCSTYTGAYCRARVRLPLEMVSALARYTGQAITARAPDAWCWRGRPVRLVDGTTVTLPDTPANQAAYPQSRNQKPGLGFPLCRIVGLVCLGSGAVLNAAFGRYSGKGGGEQSLLRLMLDTRYAGAGRSAAGRCVLCDVFSAVRIARPGCRRGVRATRLAPAHNRLSPWSTAGCARPSARDIQTCHQTGLDAAGGLRQGT